MAAVGSTLGASLAGASVAGASVAGASLAGASLAGASLAGASVAGASVAGAAVGGAAVGGAGVAPLVQAVSTSAAVIATVARLSHLGRLTMRIFLLLFNWTVLVAALPGSP